MKIIFLALMLICPNIFAATLTTNTVPYVCQGGTSPQLCNSSMSVDNNGNLNVNGTITAFGAPFVPNNIQVFTTSGTWVKPANVTKVYVKIWGDGGGGGGYGYIICNGRNGLQPCEYASGGGGGGGAYAEGVISVTGNVQVIVGQGGAVGAEVDNGNQDTSGNNGNNGTGSSFGSIIVGGGNGGGGAILNTAGSSGSGGVASGTVLAFNGFSGISGGVGTAIGGSGGNSALIMGNLSTFQTATGAPYGTGGSGNSYGNTNTSGNGSPGLVIVYY